MILPGMWAQLLMWTQKAAETRTRLHLMMCYVGVSCVISPLRQADESSVNREITHPSIHDRGRGGSYLLADVFKEAEVDLRKGFDLFAELYNSL